MGVPNSRFLYWDDLRHHPQVIENDAMSVVEHPHYGTIYQDGVPWQFSKADRLDLVPSPQMGEHTEELFRELGVGERAAAPPVPAGD